MLYLLLAVPVLLLLALSPVSELLAVLRRKQRSSVDISGPVPLLLLLVPAHNEERLIGACVRSIQQMKYPADAFRIVVIADNCTDDTAALARAEGVHCLERTDPGKPGKPQALAWAIDQLREPSRDQRVWDACVVLDADSVVDPGFADRLAKHRPLREKCVQAYFDVSNEQESWLTRLAAVLTRIRYEHAYPLKRSAGLNCPLTGNGMCIGSDLLSDGWPAFSLTENWELYARFTAAGVVIEYEPEARLFSQEASSLAQAGTQRRRWLAGRTWVLGRYLGELLRSPRLGPHEKLDSIAELASPSPVLHGFLALVLLGTAPWVLSGVGALLLSGVVLATLLPLTIHIVTVLRRHPERWQIAGCFLLLPIYALWRVLAALLTIGTWRDGAWRKTERV